MNQRVNVLRMGKFQVFNIYQFYRNAVDKVTFVDSEHVRLEFLRMTTYLSELSLHR
jgi:hypothetical protein